MKKIYVAGAYSADNLYEKVHNIERAKEIAQILWGLGYAAYCPHTNTGLFDGICDEKTFIEGHLEFMYICDGIIVVDDWGDSKGTKREIEEALWESIPVYYSIDEFIESEENIHGEV